LAYLVYDMVHDSGDYAGWLSSVLRPHQHSIGYMGDGFYRSKDPTNSIRVLKQKMLCYAVASEQNKRFGEAPYSPA